MEPKNTDDKYALTAMGGVHALGHLKRGGKREFEKTEAVTGGVLQKRRCS